MGGREPAVSYWSLTLRRWRIIRSVRDILPADWAAMSPEQRRFTRWILAGQDEREYTSDPAGRV